VADVFDELTIADNKLLKGFDIADNDHKKILDIFAARVSLYKECAEKQHDPIIKAIIEAKKMVIVSDMGLLGAQYSIKTDVSKIISRLDDLEEKISRILDRTPS
jgi:hypothetical protein